jgi:hypothetical protein
VPNPRLDPLVALPVQRVPIAGCSEYTPLSKGLRIALWTVIACAFLMLWWRGQSIEKAFRKKRHVIRSAGAGHDQFGYPVFTGNSERALELIADTIMDISRLGGIGTIISVIAAVLSALI